MKIPFIIIAMGILLSCSEKEASKKTTFYGTNHQLESIRKDIETQLAGLSLEQKLELCLLDFSFASPKYYKYLLDNKPDDVKATLLENEGFLRICKGRKIDPNDIPEGYFSADK
jgi:hypothetical protein